MKFRKVKQGKTRKGLLKRRSSNNNNFFADNLIQLLGTGFSTFSISLSSTNPNPSQVKTQALVLHGYSDTYIKPNKASVIYRVFMDCIHDGQYTLLFLLQNFRAVLPSQTAIQSPSKHPTMYKILQAAVLYQHVKLHYTNAEHLKTQPQNLLVSW